MTQNRQFFGPLAAVAFTLASGAAAAAPGYGPGFWYAPQPGAYPGYRVPGPMGGACGRRGMGPMGSARQPWAGGMYGMPGGYGQAPGTAAPPSPAAPAGAETPAATETVAAADSGEASSSAADSAEVAISGMRFGAPRIVVRKGGTVTWTNNDGMPHTVTANDGSFGSDRLGAGGTFSRTFDEAGTYGYYCAVHPMMRGEVVVVE